VLQGLFNFHTTVIYERESALKMTGQTTRLLPGWLRSPIFSGCAGGYMRQEFSHSDYSNANFLHFSVVAADAI
jgi:hypothetical protein